MARVDTSEFGVYVLNMVARRFRRNAELGGDLPGGPAAGEQAEHLRLPRAEAAGQHRPGPGPPGPRAGPRWPAAASTACTASRVQPPGPDLRFQVGRRRPGRQRGPVRAGLYPALVGVGGGQQPGRRGELRSHGAAVIARAVEPLVVRAREVTERGQPR